MRPVQLKKCMSTGSDGKASACNTGDPVSIPALFWEGPLEQGTATHCSILAWRIPWRLAGYSPWGRKELDTTEQLNDNCRAFLGRLGYLPALRGHQSPTALGNTQPSLFSGVREPSGKAGERQRQ